VGARGFNIGLNQGDIAGAGVAGHIHQHVVPRWANDINFMPIIGQTKVMSELIEDTRIKISDAWAGH
jgi:ATP adenylyltransferase